MLKYIYPVLIYASSACLISAEEYSDVYCPIPLDIRINNNTGIQCVWSSLETVGRWVGEEKLYNLTKRGECQRQAGPGNVTSVLNGIGVKHKQSYGNKEEGIKLIKQTMLEGRACAFGVSRIHMMTLIHYDEESNRVHWVDNVGSKEIKIMSIEQFQKKWDSWVIAIYPSQNDWEEKVKNRHIQAWYYSPKSI